MEQSRKKFLKHFLIGATSVPLILEACKKEDMATDTDTGAGDGSCTGSPTETAGPFPTVTPSSLVRSDIRDDRIGVVFTINITIKNVNNNCATLAGAIVDIWHQAKAKIFLADDRGLNETEWFRSFNTFNFGKYFNEHKFPLGDIYVVNDDSLDAGRSLRMIIEDLSYIILLPVIGAIGYKDSSGNDDLIAAGQAKFLVFDKNEAIEISNPFDEGLVNFLQIWIKADKSEATKGSHLFTYNVNKCLNGLLKISPVSLGTSALPFSLSIGKFEGRGGTSYHLKNKQTAVFLFVIEGAFEVQGRLLHARDGLAMWETEEVEMEALSNDAIIMIIESALK